MKLITSDIDNKNRLIAGYYFLKALFLIRKIKSIEIKPSYSKGYHLIIWTTNKYTNKDIYEIRKKIGDDKHRIRGDKNRRMGRQTLFYTKKRKSYLKIK